MTVRELLDRLHDCNPDSEVCLMTQQAWPFRNSLFGLTTSTELHHEPTGHGGQREVVYLVEGEQLGYGDHRAWELAC